MPQLAFPMPDPEDLRIRPMTPDEKRGFQYACQSLQLWAAQIERNARGLSNSGEMVPLDQMMSNGAKLTRGLAEALERQSHFERPRHG